MISILYGRGFDSWRDPARALLARGVPPAEVDWTDGEQENSLFQPPLASNHDPDSPTNPAPGPAKTSPAAGSAGVWRVPPPFLKLAETAWAHRDLRRPALLYRLLWRLTRGGEKHLMRMPTDPDLHLAESWRKSVARDIHKAHAFVRFRLVARDEETDREQFVAWFEPGSRCLRLAAPFFVKRFAGMDWSILTPEECAHWDGRELHFTPGISRSQGPAGEDGLDELWRTYYRSIFNPSRLKLAAMQSEMPVKYWKNLPEARLIPGLTAGSRARMEDMIATPGREIRPLPDNAYLHSLHARHDAIFLESPPPLEDLTLLSLPELHAAAAACRACPLWERATQTVNGEGPENARIMIVGEQPGDQEDLSGRPFTGPAGQVLRHAMALTGLDESSVYLTNAVKHFKWSPDGRKRKHLTPGKEEVRHCRPWVLAELARVRPETLVLLGGTAALSLLGREVKVTQERGLIDAPRLARRVILTWHPSYLLRLPDKISRARAQTEFEADLTLAAQT